MLIPEGRRKGRKNIWSGRRRKNEKDEGREKRRKGCLSEYRARTESLTISKRNERNERNHEEKFAK